MTSNEQKKKTPCWQCEFLTCEFKDLDLFGLSDDLYAKWFCVAHKHLEKIKRVLENQLYDLQYNATGASPFIIRQCNAAAGLLREKIKEDYQTAKAIIKNPSSKHNKELMTSALERAERF